MANASSCSATTRENPFSWRWTRTRETNCGASPATTGKEHYRGRLPEARGFTASPWANDGKVFCLDQDGVTVMIQTGPQLQVIANNKLDEMFWSSPAVVGEKLLLRGVDHLYCITK